MATGTSDSDLAAPTAQALPSIPEDEESGAPAMLEALHSPGTSGDLKSSSRPVAEKAEERGLFWYFGLGEQTPAQADDAAAPAPPPVTSGSPITTTEPVTLHGVDVSVAPFEGQQTPTASVNLDGVEASKAPLEATAHHRRGGAFLDTKAMKAVTRVQNFPWDMPYFKQANVGVRDMINLPNLTKDELMDTLKQRFEAKIVYTYIGDIVVSVNPFALTENSNQDVQEGYASLDVSKQELRAPPHIFCLVGQIYEQFQRTAKGGKSLSILISGESGAGKTEAMKLCVRHLGMVSELQVSSSNANSRGGKESVAQQLMATNPVMEPIGNAKTVRNNNSSRFGKHFDIQFDRAGTILGARTSTYLLEKPRICEHLEGERNYHIFYMLCLAAQRDDWEETVGTPFRPWRSYQLLSQKGTIGEFEDKKAWDDEKEFKDMHHALGVLGFIPAAEGDQRHQLYLLISIVLELGNLVFEPVDSWSAEDRKAREDAGAVWIPPPDSTPEVGIQNHAHLVNVAELLQVDAKTLTEALTTMDTFFVDTMVTKPLQKTQAEAGRNSLCMHIYLLAFDWCVEKINRKIARPDGEVSRCVGVLDIFGFENFSAKGQTNSFPQLCINLTNERLHELFITHVFEVEQKVYKEEDIEWTVQDYQDNKVIIKLLTRKPDGVLPLIDDACRQVGEADLKKDAFLLDNLNKTYKNEEYHETKRPTGVYETSKKKESFTIHHFAGPVTYNVLHFVEKNKDELGPKLSAILETHTHFKQLKELHGKFRTKMADDDVDARKEKIDEKRAGLGGRGGGRGGGNGRGGGRGAPARKAQKTVSKSFSQQLNSLMDRLNQTDHRYIRCLKPNHVLKPGVWDAALMLRQLSYSGTLEVCKVRKAGLNVRKPLKEFYASYKVVAKDMEALGSDKGKALNLRDLVTMLMEQLSEQIPSTKYRVGKTLMFMQSREIMDALDKLVEAKKMYYLKVISSIYKAERVRAEYRHVKRTIVNMQHRFRGKRVMRAYAEVRFSSQSIQYWWKRHFAHVVAKRRVLELRIEQAKCQRVNDETKMARKLKELIDNVDLMVNDRTKDEISLTLKIAQRIVSADPAWQQQSVSERNAEIERERERLKGASPFEILRRATNDMLVETITTLLRWERSGASIHGEVRRTIAEDQPPKLPKWTTVHEKLGWFEVTVEELPPDEKAEDEAPMQVCTMRLSAKLYQGTLLLEKIDESAGDEDNAGHLELFGIYPLTMCALRAPAFLKEDEGRQVTVQKGEKTAAGEVTSYLVLNQKASSAAGHYTRRRVLGTVELETIKSGSVVLQAVQAIGSAARQISSVLDSAGEDI